MSVSDDSSGRVDPDDRLSDAPPAPATNGVALITGAATGIGAAIASGFREAGWNAHVCDVNPDAIAEFRQWSPGSTASVADVGDPDQADAVVQDVFAEYGQLDVLINNAGVAGPTARIDDIDPEAWRRTIDININGPFYFARRAAPLMRERGGGCIINVASTAALFGFPMRSPYAASKWAMIGFTKTLAMELGPDGIRVNAICPGSVEGPRIDAVMQREADLRGLPFTAVREVYERQTSMRTFVRGEDIAAMCLFLASDAGARISGQAIAVDGHTESLSFPF